MRSYETNLYVTFDKVALQYGPIFEQPNDEAAKRAFKKMAKEVDLSDYELLLVGHRKDKNEQIELMTIPQAIVRMETNE